MNHFAALLAALESAQTDARRVDALWAYLAKAPAADAAWAVYLLGGRGVGRRLNTTALRAAACRATGMPPWLFDACLQASGDWAETVAHWLPPAARRAERPLHEWMTQQLPLLAGDAADAACEQALRWCGELNSAGREWLLRLLLGRWRRVVSDTVLRAALARHAGVDERLLALRWPAWLQARRPPDGQRWRVLLQHEPVSAAERGWAYPFATIAMVDADEAGATDHLGDAAQWIVHELRGTVRAQLVRRAAGCWLWSSAGALCNAEYPLVVGAAHSLPIDTVVEGELLIADAPSAGALRVTDVLEVAGHDLRALPFEERTGRGRELNWAPPIDASESIAVGDGPSLVRRWAGARQRGINALRLMRRDAPYGVAGAVWDWRAPALRVTAVVQAAETVSDDNGRFCIEFGVALWSRRPASDVELQRALAAGLRGERLPSTAAQWLPIAKVRVDAEASGAPGAALRDWLRQATAQRFGPVRWLQPSRCCDIGFDGVVISRRRRSGFVLHGARFLRWRDDVTPSAVDELERLRGCA